MFGAVSEASDEACPVLRVVGVGTRVDINELVLERAIDQDLEDGNPIDAGGFHRDVRDATRREPVRQPVKTSGEGREGLDRRGIAIRWDGDEMLGGSAVDSGGVRVESFEGGGG